MIFHSKIKWRMDAKFYDIGKYYSNMLSYVLEVINVSFEQLSSIGKFSDIN